MPNVPFSVGLLARKPRSLSFEEGSESSDGRTDDLASVHREGATQSASACWIQAGAGGVGRPSQSNSKHMGAFVVATGGPGSQDFMAKLGADVRSTILVKKFEGAGPFDVVYDGVCGPLVERGLTPS